ncbi:MAG: AAA family ATPase [Bradymonadaceae bacterium]|nr:AAA family ATPase [Lujinxingiaceae bacterium]
MAALKARFEQGNRLIVVTGPPGVGKSRVVQEFCHRHLAELSAPVDAVAFIKLVDARGLPDITAALARALDVPIRSSDAPADVIEQLIDSLEQRERLLLVIDHAEAVIDELRTLVSRWLGRLPKLLLLVASRERLALSAEHIVELGPLSLCGPNGAMEDSAAFALFMERAHAVDPSFAPGPAQRQTIGELITELQGLPLAIALAASRIAVADVKEILRRIREDAFVVLRPGQSSNDQLPALETALLASWRLLEPFEQDALAQCAVFRGGFDLALAEDVLDLGAHANAPSVIDVLQSLRSKSLIAPPVNGRLTLYRVIAVFAAARQGERAERVGLERRHAAALAARAAAFARDEWFWKTREPRAWFDANLGNIDKALGRIEADLDGDACDSGTARELAWMLGFGLLTASPWLPEALQRAEALLVLGEQRPSDAYFRFGRQLARARFKTGLHDEGIALFEQLAAQATHHGEQGWAIIFETQQIICEGTHRGPQPNLIERSQALVQSALVSCDDFIKAFALLGQGRTLRIFGQLRQARESDEQAARLAHACGAGRLSVEISLALGHLALEAGEPGEAARHFENVIRMAHESDFALAQTLASAARASAHRDAGEFSGSEQVFQEHLMPMAEQGYACDWTVALEYALTLLDMANWSEARQLFKRIEDSTRRYYSPQAPIAIAVHVALMQASMGQMTDARTGLVAFAGVDTQSLWGRRLANVRRLLASLDGKCDDPDELEAHRKRLELAGQPVECQTVCLLLAAHGLCLSEHTDDVQQAGAALASVHAIMRAVFTPMPETPAPWVRRSAWIRVLTRLVAERLPLEISFAIFAETIDPSQRALIVHPAGLFRPPAGQQIVDMRAQKLVANLLGALITQHFTDRQRSIATSVIFERVWPDEEFGLAAPQRIYNKISALKKKGLRDVLLNSSDGYLIEPTLEVIVYEPELGLVDSFMKLARR